MAAKVLLQFEQVEVQDVVIRDTVLFVLRLGYLEPLLDLLLAANLPAQPFKSISFLQFSLLLCAL